MTSTAHTTSPTAHSSAGERIEQARYQIPDGIRALVAQRINGRVALVDAADGDHERVVGRALGLAGRRNGSQLVAAVCRVVFDRGAVSVRG